MMFMIMIMIILSLMGTKLSGRLGEKLHARELSKTQSILRFDGILQHDN